MRISDWISDVCSSDLLFFVRGNVVLGRASSRAGSHTLDFCRSQKPVGAGLLAKLCLLAAQQGSRPRAPEQPGPGPVEPRSDERRVGNECVSTCRSRGSHDDLKKKKNQQLM